MKYTIRTTHPDGTIREREVKRSHYRRWKDWKLAASDACGAEGLAHRDCIVEMIGPDGNTVDVLPAMTTWQINPDVHPF